MKKLLFVLFAVMGILFFSACQQDELITEVTEVEAVTQTSTVIDTVKIATVLDNEKTLSRDTVPILMATKSLKSGQEFGGKNWFVKKLHKNETIIFTDERGKVKARRFSVYIETIEIDQKQFINQIYTISQTYDVIDGIVDLSGWYFNYEFGCPQLKQAYLQKIQHAYNVNFFFRSDDADQTLYYTSKDDYWGGWSPINLIPLADGNWQISGETNDGGFEQKFASSLIDCYDLSYGINLEIKMNSSDIVAGISLDLESLVGVTSILIEGTDQNGNYIYKRFPFIYNDELPDAIFYGVSFNPTSVLIQYNNYWNKWFEVNHGCWYQNKDGMKYYCLMDNIPVPVG